MTAQTVDQAATSKPTYVYVTYIKTTAEKVWQALTDGEVTRQYWGGQQNVSDWQVGSEWRHQMADDPSLVDGVGTVVEVDRPRRLVVTWAMPADAGDPSKYSRVTYDIAEDQGVVRLTVTEHALTPSEGSDEGWPRCWPASRRCWRPERRCRHSGHATGPTGRCSVSRSIAPETSPPAPLRRGEGAT
jgi:uncharacterized protein YndB with AHSA1/START domain